ncbi:MULTISPECIES: TonB-dependent receptor [unclassified Luteimonas]
MKRKPCFPSRTLERSLLSAALAGLLLSAPAFAQSTAATIRGEVMVDSTPAAQAQVTATNLATGLTRSVQTGAKGSYNLVGLPPGTYRIDVNANGQASSQNVTVAVGQTATLDLGVGGVAETGRVGEATDLDAVVVTAQALVETRTSEVATYVSQKQIESLPQGTRNFLAFADTVPGMQFTQGGDGSTRLRSGAQTANAINVFIDGVGQKNYVLAGGVSGQDSTRGNPFPQSAIGEYKVITSNYKAEFDQLSSAAIVAATRSGSNEFGGSFFWDRTSTDWRAASESENESGEKAEFKEEQYGASFEGPIIRDRLHFFLAYEAKEYMSPRVVTPGQGFESRVEELPAALQPLVGTFSSPFKQDMFFGKLTWTPGDAHLVELTTKIREEDELGNFDGTRTAQYGSLKENTDKRFDLRYQYSAERFLNDMHVTYEDAFWRPRPATLAPGYILTTSNPDNVILQAGGGPDYQDKGQKGIAIQNDFTFYAGAHTIKAGVKFKDIEISSLQQDPYNPQFRYDIGQSLTVPFQVRFGAPLAGDGTGSITTSGKQYGLYIQDDWEVNEKLTLNLGIRWDYETNPAYTDYVTPGDFVTALQSWPNINAPGSGIAVGDYISTGSERSNFKDAWQPRVGFSYDLQGDQRHVIFGGAGRAYDRNLFSQLALESIRYTFPPYTFSFDAPGHPCDPTAPSCLAWDPAYYDPEALYALTAANPNLGAERYILHNDLKTPYSDQFSIGMRNALGDWMTEVTLSRIESHDGLVFHLGNRRPGGDFFAPGTTWGQPWDDGAFGVPGFGRLIIGTNGIETHANTLAIKFDKPYTENSGWGVTVAYTYTDAEQNADTTSGGAFRYPDLGYYGWVPTEGVPEHRLVATGIYDAPWGIVLSGKVSLATPSPRYGDNCLPGWDDCYFDYYTPDDTLGFKQVDLAASKTWDTGTDLSFYVRGDVLNVFNWVNYDGRNDWFGEPGNPNPNLGQPNSQLLPTRTFKLSFGLNW